MMNFPYSFLLGVSTGLVIAFFSLGHFWAGVLAGIPIGIALLVVLVVILMAWAEADEWWHTEERESGTGDGYRN